MTTLKQCPVAQQINTYTFYVFSLLVFILVLWGFIAFLQKRNHHLPQFLSISLISFYVFALLTVVLMCFNSYNISCILQTSITILESQQWYQIMFIVFIFCYICHWYSLINVLFLRLRLVFNSDMQMYPQLRVSKCTAITFGIMSGILIIDVLLTIMSNPYLPINEELSQLFPAFFMLYGLLDIIISLYITFLFIQKLWRLNKLVSMSKALDNEHDSLIPMITKCTILTSISTLSTILALLTQGLNWGFLLDIFTNFICVTLTLSFAQPVYDRYFSFIDARCQRCMNGCAAASKCTEDVKMTAHNVNANLPPFVDTHTSTSISV